MSRPAPVIDIDTAIIFLNDAARYFKNLSPHGEDRAYWAYLYNCDNCLRIVELLKTVHDKQ